MMTSFFRACMALSTLLASTFVGLQVDLSDYLREWYPTMGHVSMHLESETLTYTIDDYFRDNVFLHKTTNDILDEMTVEDMAGQLLMPAWEKGTTLDEIVNIAKKYHVGGLMVLRNDAKPGQVQLLEDVLLLDGNQASLVPLIATDAEPSLMKYRFPQAGYTVNTRDIDSVDQAYEAAETIANIISPYGYNLDFAPVYDNGRNATVIGDRAFSTQPSEIALRANSFVQGLKDHGIFATAKHFPGHGYAQGDTHLTLESVPGSLPELPVFESAIASRVPFVMVGHLVVNGDAYDSVGLPSTLSLKVMTHLLREELGFTGVIITDAMTMGALSSFNEVDVRALDAGADIILMPRDIENTFNTLVTRMNADAEYKKTIRAKVYRIVRMRLVSTWVTNKD